jgi:hypothetical protein
VVARTLEAALRVTIPCLGAPRKRTNSCSIAPNLRDLDLAREELESPRLVLPARMSLDPGLGRLHGGALFADAIEIRLQFALDRGLAREVTEEDAQEHLIECHRGMNRLADELLQRRLAVRSNCVDLLVGLAGLRQRATGDVVLFA